MTRPCAVDRREPMVRAVAAGASRRATAAKLEVSPSCVVKLLQRWRRAGTLEPAPAGGGPSLPTMPNASRRCWPRRQISRRALPRRRRAGAGAEAARGRSRGGGQPRRPQGRGVSAAIAAAGARGLHLPPDSPDRNPIEQVFAKLSRSSPSSKACAAAPQPAPSRRFGASSVNRSTPSAPKNAPTTSPTPAMFPSNREML